MKRILLSGLLLAGLIACRSGGTKSTTSTPSVQKPRGELRHRAEQYWDARVQNKWDVVYDYLEPWQQQSGTEEEYVSWAKDNEPFNILRYEILDVQQDGPYGWVRLSYDSTLRVYPGAPPRTTQVDQKWAVQRGNWYPIPTQQDEFYPVTPLMRDQAAEAKLRDRFSETWPLRLSADWSGLYQYTDPRDRDDVPLNEFSDSEGLFDYQSHDLKWVEVVGDKGKVRVTYVHTVTDPSLSKLPPRNAEISEQWIKVNNEWYRDLK